MEKALTYIITLLLGIVVGASVAYSTAPQPTTEKHCYKSVSYEVDGDKVVETWLPANDICK